VKAINKLIILCIAICVLAVTAAAQTTWKLSTNLLVTSNEISFNQGANGVWYFLESRSFAHDPKSYKFLSDYSSPCNTNPLEVLINGVSCWRNPDLDSQGNHAPLVGVNFTYRTQFTNNFGIPRRSVWMHPGIDRLAIVGWKSPITGLVNVAGYFSDLDPNCGNGVIWSVDRVRTKLASGTIANGGASQSFSLVNVSVGTGQVLYFVVDPNRDSFCDSTGIDVTISTSK
jgi:hypothetical protein